MTIIQVKIKVVSNEQIFYHYEITTYKYLCMYTVIVIILAALLNVWPTLLDETVKKQNYRIYSHSTYRLLTKAL